MNIFEDRRLILVGGAGLALLTGLAVAVMMISHPGPGADASPPQNGLTVQSGRNDDVKLDPKAPLRCFVAGRSIGELPLNECARRNGVASGALDVGLDKSGALAAGHGEAQLTPLPAPTAAPMAPNPPRADDSGFMAPAPPDYVAPDERRTPPADEPAAPAPNPQAYLRPYPAAPARLEARSYAPRQYARTDYRQSGSGSGAAAQEDGNCDGC